MIKRGVLACGLVLVVALGSGCLASSETRSNAKGLRDRLGTPSWASSVDVATGLDGRFEDFVQVTVTLKSSANAEDLADFVESLPGVADDAGVDGPGLTFVSPARAHLDVEWGADAAHDQVAGGVSEWLAVAGALGGAVAATAGPDGSAYVLSLGDGPAGAVHEAYDAVSPLSRPGTAWQVTSTSGALSLDLSTSAVPSAQQLDTWDALVGSLDRVPAALPATLLSLHFLDRTVADFGLQAPDDTTNDSFSVAAYGAQVWPVVRPQLAALATLPDAWTYGASWAPSYAPLQDNIFISLLSDQDPVDNGDESTKWSQAAQDYVQGL